MLTSSSVTDCKHKLEGETVEHSHCSWFELSATALINGEIKSAESALHVLGLEDDGDQFNWCLFENNVGCISRGCTWCSAPANAQVLPEELGHHPVLGNWEKRGHLKTNLISVQLVPRWNGSFTGVLPSWAVNCSLAMTWLPFFAALLA